MFGLLKSIGLIYDPDTDAVPSPVVRAEPDKPDTIRTPKRTLPDNVTFTPSGHAYRYTDMTDGRAWEQAGQADGQRSGHVGHADTDVIKVSGLDEFKYRELKPLWASEMSAAQASKLFHGKRGYGERTLEKYWAAFNSLPS